MDPWMVFVGVAVGGFILLQLIQTKESDNKSQSPGLHVKDDAPRAPKPSYSAPDFAECERVMHAFGRELENPKDFKGMMLMPASQLPYPKGVIRRSLETLISAVESGQLKMGPRAKVIDSLRTALSHLDEHYFDIPAHIIPRDREANLKMWSRVRKRA